MVASRRASRLGIEGIEVMRGLGQRTLDGVHPSSGRLTARSARATRRGGGAHRARVQGADRRHRHGHDSQHLRGDRPSSGKPGAGPTKARACGRGRPGRRLTWLFGRCTRGPARAAGRGPRRSRPGCGARRRGDREAGGRRVRLLHLTHVRRGAARPCRQGGACPSAGRSRGRSRTPNSSGERLVERLERLLEPDRWPDSAPPESIARAALAAAELERLKGVPAPETWTAVAARWAELGLRPRPCLLPMAASGGRAGRRRHQG